PVICGCWLKAFTLTVRFLIAACQPLTFRSTDEFSFAGFSRTWHNESNGPGDGVDFGTKVVGSRDSICLDRRSAAVVELSSRADCRRHRRCLSRAQVVGRNCVGSLPD